MNDRRMRWMPLLVLVLSPWLSIAAAQGNFPPTIVDVQWEINRFLASGLQPAVDFDPLFDIAREEDVLTMTIWFVDLDLAEGEGGEEIDEEFYVRKLSLWVLDFPDPPEPPPVRGDTNGWVRVFPAIPSPDKPDGSPNDDITLCKFTLTLIIPQWSGPNQRRLRDPIGHPYDVGWLMRLDLSNEEAPDESLFVGAEWIVLAVENPAFAPPNPPVVADAGGDRTVGSGSLVLLDATQSFDARNVGFDPTDPDVFDKDVLSFTWELVLQPDGLTADELAAATPVEFPEDERLAVVTLTVLGQYAYRVLVSDNVNPLPGSDTVVITVVDPADLANQAPQAVIVGPTEKVAVGETITLDGSGSSDPDGDPLSYIWRQTDAVGGVLPFEELRSAFQPLSGREAVTSTWRAILPGIFYFRLLVADPSLATGASAVYTIEVVESGAAGETFNRPGGASADGAPVPAAPLACGAGILPVGLVPVVLMLTRTRRR